MSSLTSELIQDRVNLLEPSYQSFIRGGEVSKIAEAFSSFHEFDEETATLFENGVFLYFIFFLDETGFINYLISDCLLNRDDATLLALAVRQALPDNLKPAFDVTQKILAENYAKADAEAIQNQENNTDFYTKKDESRYESNITSDDFNPNQTNQTEDFSDFSEENTNLEEAESLNNETLPTENINQGNESEEQIYTSSQDDILNQTR